MESASRQGGASARQVQVSHAMLPHEAELPHTPCRCRPRLGAPYWLSPHLEANMRSVVGKFLKTSAWAGVECQCRLPRPGHQEALRVLSWHLSGSLGLDTQTCAHPRAPKARPLDCVAWRWRRPSQACLSFFGKSEMLLASSPEDMPFLRRAVEGSGASGETLSQRFVLWSNPSCKPHPRLHAAWMISRIHSPVALHQHNFDNFHRCWQMACIDNVWNSTAPHPQILALWNAGNPPTPMPTYQTGKPLWYSQQRCAFPVQCSSFQQNCSSRWS